MGWLSLDISSLQIVWRLGKDSWMAPGWTLSWNVRFDRYHWNNVKVASGGDLRDMPATLTLRVGEMNSKRSREEDKEPLSSERGGPPIGSVTFVPAYGGSEDDVFEAQPDSYDATLLVSEAQLESIISKVLAGQSPRHVRLYVPHFKYGSAPDGSQQTWDNTEQLWAEIDGATFTFGEDVRDPEEAIVNTSLVDPPVLPLHSAEAQAITELGQRIGQAFNWIFVILIAILVAIILRLFLT